MVWNILFDAITKYLQCQYQIKCWFMTKVSFLTCFFLVKASEHIFTTMALDESSSSYNKSFIMALFLGSMTYRKRLVAQNKTSLLLNRSSLNLLKWDIKVETKTVSVKKLGTAIAYTIYDENYSKNWLNDKNLFL